MAFLSMVFLAMDMLRGKIRPKGKIQKVAWFGAYGNGNLGDDLIFYSLKRIFKDQNFDIALSIRDFDRLKCYGTKVFLKGEQFYDFWKYIKQIKTADAIFLGGGGLFEYYYTSKQAYRMIMIYLCPLMLAKIFGKPSYVLGMGVNKEQIDHPIIRFLYRKTLSSCQVIVTRDQKSKNGLVNNHVITQILVAYDPVLSLDFNKYQASKKEGHTKPKIGFLLWPYFLWPHFYKNSEQIGNEKREQHSKFKEKIRTIIDVLKDTHDLHFLTFHFSDTLLYEEMGVSFSQNASLMEFVKKTRSMDMMVTMRYHGQIMSLLFEKPIISISVQQKMDALAKNYDINEYNHDVSDFDPLKVVDQVYGVLGNIQPHKTKIKENNQIIKSKIVEVYKGVQF
ncbi:polysaccharide pyruvyl transferase family protein [Flagellimonas pelagia]|uniref:polysaccharide pyruvyl transferase family protein n=1 Tax=Flagellimonas pelagia TaxID=2306998 RepID=UPI0016054A26|nr:polysaccharide pyruvyl transferase family protein [Allomuricauda maritima]